MDTYQDELMHYGVPGMKWGVRKERYKAMGRRDRAAQRYKYRSDKQFSKISESEQRGIGRAEKRLAKAQAKGASSKKISKLERNLSDKKAHADIINKRNKDWQRREMDTIRNESALKRGAKAAIGLNNRNYTKATDRALDNAVRKYGNEQVKRVKRRDTAKVVAAVTAIVAAQGALTYAQMKSYGY